MDKVVEQLTSITDFREALMAWIRAREEAIRLELDHKLARSSTYIDLEGKTHYRRWAEVDVKTDEMAREAERAKVRSTALFNLMIHLRGDDEETKVNLEDG